VSVRVSTWAWKQPLGGNRKLVLLALAEHANDEGTCYPGQRTLAAKCGISERALQTHLAALEAAGFIERERRHRGDGTRKSDMYTLSLPDDSACGPGDKAQISRDLPADSCQPEAQSLRVVKEEEPSGEPSGEPNSNAAFLCRLLADLITANDPKAKAKAAAESDAWVSPMRKLLAERDGDAVEVERIIRWSQADGFWSANILSPSKLRKQFTQLALKARNRNGGAPSRRESPSDLLRALHGGTA